MSRQARYIIPGKASPRKIGEGTVGGKALNLLKLRSLGFAVPPFFVVSTRAFKEALIRWQPKIWEGLRTQGIQSVDEIERLSSNLMEVVGGIQFSDELCHEIREAASASLGHGGRFAVRSSIVGEDGARNSFAGQMDSFLDVPETGLFEAIKKVWASAFSPRALIYRKEKRLRGDDIAAAVIIQKMVAAVASGILFTRDPNNRSRECIISAGFGLGEGIVSNRVETDTYKISWRGGAVSRKLAVKNRRIMGKSQAQGGTAVVPVPERMKTEPVLTEAQVRALRDIGIKAERSFGLPLDIEWALDGRGIIHILQARPIVFAEASSPAENRRVWDNSNVVESYPGLTLPLTFSFIRRCYEIIFRDAAGKLAQTKKAVEHTPDIFPNMIGLIDGRVYYNLLNWYAMQACFPGFSRYKGSWDRMIGISENTPFTPRRLSFIHTLWTALKMGWIILAVKRTARKFFKSFNWAYDKFKDTDFSRASEYGLVALYEAIHREFSRKWYLTLYNDFCAIKFYDWLKTLIARWIPREINGLQNSLLCGVRRMESIAPIHSLAHLAKMINSNPDYRHLFGQEDNRKIWLTIQQNPSLAPLRAVLNAHLQAYGDRSLEELKLEKPTLREEPALLIRIIKDFLPLGLGNGLAGRKDQEIRREAEATVKRLLRNPFKRLAFEFVLKNARRAVAQRENMRFARTRLFGIMRSLFSRLGRRLEENHFLNCASDIHYLTMEEVSAMVHGTAVTQNLRGLVSLRKAEYQCYARKSLQARFETTGMPYLHSAREESAGRNGNKRLKGISCSPGIARGTAKVVINPRLSKGNRDSILVAQSTDPGWVFLMISAKGIITEHGSVLSHTAIIGRELGIPTIVGVKNATKLIPDGVSLCIDGGTGDVRWE